MVTKAEILEQDGYQRFGNWFQKDGININMIGGFIQYRDKVNTNYIELNYEKFDVEILKEIIKFMEL